MDIINKVGKEKKKEIVMQMRNLLQKKTENKAKRRTQRYKQCEFYLIRSLRLQARRDTKAVKEYNKNVVANNSNGDKRSFNPSSSS